MKIPRYVAAIALLTTAVVVLTFTPAAADTRHATACLDPDVPLSVEETRLRYVLPRQTNPAVDQDQPFAQQMIEGGGFGYVAPKLTRELCRTLSRTAATTLVEQTGQRLWRSAVQRAQAQGPIRGDLPFSDDRPLYWTRLQTTAALRQWTPSFDLSVADRTTLITTFDRASRGMFEITFPAGDHVRRVIVSGFDPFGLDGGVTGPAPGSVGNNIRHGNPSGATALSLDGTRYRTADGTVAYFQAYTLPVNYAEFRRGYLEDTVGPFMLAGPRQVDASVTISQGGDSVFDLERTNGRYHGEYAGNDNGRPCPPVNGAPQLAVDNKLCNISVVQRWGGPADFSLFDPPQWTTTTLPITRMIEADTGAGVPRPPGDSWPDPSTAFGVRRHTELTEFPDCVSTDTVTRNGTDLPSPDSCAYQGSGGNYLSNESAYRNTLLRDRLGLNIPAGHIHTPDMQHFETAFLATDPTFDAWRQSIVEQTRNLIHVVADSTL